LWLSEIILAVEVHDKHVGRLHELFLHATRRNVDFVFMADAGSSTSTCYLARFACQSWLLSRIFIVPRPPRGLVVPSLGCRTLRRACKCGSLGGSGLRSAPVPPYLDCWTPCCLAVCARGIAQAKSRKMIKLHPTPPH
jgi:hypothetical protein